MSANFLSFILFVKRDDNDNSATNVSISLSHGLGHHCARCAAKAEQEDAVYPKGLIS